MALASLSICTDSTEPLLLIDTISTGISCTTVPFTLLQTSKRGTADFGSDITTLDRRQSKPLLKIVERGSKIARTSVFNCHLSPVGRQMAIENSVSSDFIYVRR